MLIPPCGAAVPFVEEEACVIAECYGLVSPPCTDEEWILWIESSPPLFPDSWSLFGVSCSVHAFNTMSNTSVLIRSHASRAASPDIEGNLGVWEEARGDSTDIILNNFSSGKVTALHTPGFQHNPRVSSDRIVWEEESGGGHDIYMYDLSTGHLSSIAVGDADSYAPDISGDLVVWAEEERGVTSVMLQDLSTKERRILGCASGTVRPRIDSDTIIWENGGSVIFCKTGGAASLLTAGPGHRSGAVIGDDIAAWAEDGHIVCHLMSGEGTEEIGNSGFSSYPAVSGTGIAWTEDGSEGQSTLLYRRFFAAEENEIQLLPVRSDGTASAGGRTGRICAGGCDWYKLEIPPGTAIVSLDLTWEKEAGRLSCMLVGPSGEVLFFEDGDDGMMDSAIHISATSALGISPGHWFCAVSSKSGDGEETYNLQWREVAGKSLR